jgi:hypothetical protein
MPCIRSWLPTPVELPWEYESVAYHYDSQAGPRYASFPMTGLLPINIVEPEDLIGAPSPLWITYLEPEDGIGTLDTKGDKTYRFSLPPSFEEYIEQLDYDARKEMRYVLRKNADLLVIENQKEDLLAVCDEHFRTIRERCIAEGETPFSLEGIELLKRIYRTDACTTLSFIDPVSSTLLGVNVSFRRKGIVYDSVCMRPVPELAKKRSLGTFAILKNIEVAIREKQCIYDMLVGDWGYKPKFGAKPVAMRHIIHSSRGFATAYGIPLCDVDRLEE